MKVHSLLVVAGFAAAFVPGAKAWDYEGHRLVNRVALAALPQDFPAFVRTPDNAERVAFLAGEPDRWRNDATLPLQQTGGMDHYLDVEELPEAGLDLRTVSSFRYDFAVAFAQGRAAHPEAFPAIDPTKNSDHSREWAGFVPWAITENFGKLRSAFSYLKAYQELGTKEEVANAEANIVYVMGVMGHYVGDSAQPLHTTIHHHGWVGPNPNGYTSWPGIHAWVDGGFIAKAGIKFPELAPKITPAVAIDLTKRADGRDPMFDATVDYFLKQHALVEPLYQLEKAGKLGHHDQPITEEGRAFIDQQIVAGGEMLASIWLTAWQTAAPDNFLRNSLANRKARAAGLPPPPPSPLPARK